MYLNCSLGRMIMWNDVINEVVSYKEFLTILIIFGLLCYGICVLLIRYRSFQAGRLNALGLTAGFGKRDLWVMSMLFCNLVFIIGVIVTRVSIEQTFGIYLGIHGFIIGVLLKDVLRIIYEVLFQLSLFGGLMLQEFIRNRLSGVQYQGYLIGLYVLFCILICTATFYRGIQNYIKVLQLRTEVKQDEMEKI